MIASRRDRRAARRARSADGGRWRAPSARWPAVNLGAIERNCARLRARAARGARCARSSRPTATGTAPCRRARAALAGGASWLAVATARRGARAARRRGSTAPRARDGRADAGGARVALGAGADVVAWRERARRARCGAPRRRSRARQARHRHGPARAPATRDEATRVAEAVAAAPGVELAGAMTHFATADETGDAFFARAARRASRLGRASCARSHPGVVAPRRQLRRDAARPGEPLRHGALRRRDLRPGPVPAPTRPSTGSSRRWSCAPTSPRSSALAPGESVGYGRRFVAARRHVDRDAADRLRRRRAARALEQRRRARRRAPPPARRHGQHGQHHRRRSARTPPCAPATRRC